VRGKIPSFVRVKLLSDATFSRGEPAPGMVDIEVEHDKAGLPFIRGRTLRGLFRDSWLSMYPCFPALQEAAVRVLGKNRALDESCRLRIGDALLPRAVREAARAAIERQVHPLSADEILRALTTIRYQTAEERESGAPAETTLRSSRVVLRGLYFDAPLEWLDGYLPRRDELRVLALCALATRHGGLTRNRGRGHVLVTLDGDLELTRSLAEEES